MTAALNELLAYRDGELETDLRIYLHQLQARRSAGRTEALSEQQSTRFSSMYLP